MLRVSVPAAMLKSFSSTSTNQLAPNAWPQTAEDGFAINGNGGPAYSGTIPYGVTFGIPSTAVEPAAVKANAGANMLWTELQDHGAMIRDQGGASPNIAFETDQTLNPNDPLIQGMTQIGAQIMASAQILANQAEQYQRRRHTDRAARSATERCAGRQRYQRDCRAEPNFRRGYIRHFYV
jgi:hypothetical protein